MRDPEERQPDGTYDLTIIVVNEDGDPEWDLVPTYLTHPAWKGTIITDEEAKELKNNNKEEE